MKLHISHKLCEQGEALPFRRLRDIGNVRFDLPVATRPRLPDISPQKSCHLGLLPFTSLAICCSLKANPNQWKGDAFLYHSYTVAHFNE
jgi:hypothetical protein